MTTRTLLIAALLVPLAALAASPFTALHPEEAYPDSATPLVSLGPYTGLVQEVQKKLHQQGFDAGPVNGDLSGKTQAALAQFQLSRGVPASGQLDDQTLAALGVSRSAALPVQQ
jgi:peptidoglycan hydrolase-like protein with peptidoglycan-binding domain